MAAKRRDNCPVAHLANFGTVWTRLKVVQVTQLQVQDVAEELAKLREPLSPLGPTSFTLEYGIAVCLDDQVTEVDQKLPGSWILSCSRVVGQIVKLDWASWAISRFVPIDEFACRTTVIRKQCRSCHDLLTQKYEARIKTMTASSVDAIKAMLWKGCYAETLFAADVAKARLVRCDACTKRLPEFYNWTEPSAGGAYRSAA